MAQYIWMMMPRIKSVPLRVPAAPARQLGHAVQSDSWRAGNQSSTARGYNYRWQQARLRYFSKHPLCVHCQRAGKVVMATDLDHIVPHRGNQQAFWDECNWQGLCKPCHSAKTQSE